jgi:diazepam-binding inhibitor (GABA receptor modulating acyl-CoA-binding protein)
MAISDDFAAAQVRIKQLTRAPATDELLELYSLYKQATLGDAAGKRPEALDFKGRAKFDAWASRKAMSRDDAMTAYVALVAKLTRQYG